MIMTRRYQNTAFTSGKASFIEVDNIPNTEADISARKVSAQIQGTVVPMVRAKVAIRRETTSNPCGSECAIPVVESFAVEFNVKQGAENLDAIRTECLRVLDAAIEQYKLDTGLVPPVYADFAEE